MRGIKDKWEIYSSRGGVILLKQQKAKFYFADYLKVFAIILITNSHFDEVYPWSISFGGAPGNALFFMISGFLLADIGADVNIIQWYWRRIKRIYPSVWITTLVLILGGYFTINGVGNVFLYFIYPTAFWYIAAILINYVLFYLVRRADIKPWITILTAVIVYTYKYVVNFDETTFFVETLNRGISGFIAIMIGAMIKDWITGKYDLKGNKQKTGENLGKLQTRAASIVRKKRLLILSMAVIALGGFLTIKLMIQRIEVAYYVQFLTHLFSLIFATFSMLFFYSFESKLRNMKDGVLCRFITVISSCSLEIYMIQRWEIGLLCGINFPFNFILIVITVLTSAWMIHWGVERLTHLIDKGINKIGSRMKS